MKNKLQENMKRFGTKNISEQTKSMSYLDQLEKVLQLTQTVPDLTIKGKAGNHVMAVYTIQELLEAEHIGDEVAFDLMDIIPIIGDTIKSIECLKKLENKKRLR